MEQEKIQIHRLQEEISGLLSNELKDKIKQLINAMSKLDEEFKKNKPHRWYMKSYALDEARRAYINIIK